MTVPSRGFRALPENAARVDRWTLTAQDGPSYDNPTAATDWTYYQGLQAAVDLLLDPGSLARHVGLSDDAAFGATLAWRARTAQARGSSPIIPIVSSETTVTVDIPPGHAGGTLSLTVKIVLLSPGTGVRDALAPAEAGAILWTDSHSVALEGIAARLPILPVTHHQQPFNDRVNSRWWIKVDTTDLDAPIDVAMRVYVNESNPNVYRMMSDPSGPVAAAMTSSLLLDIQRELVRIAVDEVNGFDPGTSYETDSLGAALAASVGLLGSDFEEIRNKAVYDAAVLDVEIQGILGEEHALD